VDQIPCVFGAYFRFGGGASTAFRKKEVEESRRILWGFCSPGSVEDPHLPRQREIARTPGRTEQVNALSVQEVDYEWQTECQQHNQVQRSHGGTQSPEVFGGDVAAAIPDWCRPTGVGSKDAH